MKSLFAFIILFTVLWLNPAAGQINEPNTTIEDTISEEGDFGLFDENNKNTFRVLFSGNPGRAALYSLVLPGAGQFYNKRYWKIPLVYAGLGAVGYLFYINNKSYQDKKADYLNSFGTVYENTYFVIYQDAKQTREQSIFAIVGVHLFNIFDAYIDRHLIDFDMSEDLSIRIKPYPDGISPIGLSIAYQLD